jgi:hypothetical protein
MMNYLLLEFNKWATPKFAVVKKIRIYMINSNRWIKLELDIWTLSEPFIYMNKPTKDLVIQLKPYLCLTN